MFAWRVLFVKNTFHYNIHNKYNLADKVYTYYVNHLKSECKVNKLSYNLQQAQES